MNILLVNTNRISIRFVEELLAKNNIKGEIAMVRAGKFALDLVLGMNVDLLVCEIESETKEKTKHFLVESRKMTPDAYYFILMDGESLEYMEEDFLNSLDDFITIPFEDRALKLRLNRGIQSWIEKKKKAGITSIRSAAKAPEPAPQETQHTVMVPTSEPVQSLENPGMSPLESAPGGDEEAASGSSSVPRRRIPREEFQYEPSYEELLQQRNKILRKEKEAAWLQAMSNQISSYTFDEVPEKPTRIRDERKSDPVIPPDAEPLSVIQPEPEILVPAQVIPLDTESGPPLAVEPVKDETLHVEKLPVETQPVQTVGPTATSSKPKSKVKSFFESLSKVKSKPVPQPLQPLFASSGADREGAEPGQMASSTPEPLKVPDSEPQTGPVSTSTTIIPEESYSSTSTEPFSEPSAEHTLESLIEPSSEPSVEPDSHEQDSPEDPDFEDPASSDDIVPEESFLEAPVTDEEYTQEIPPPVPEVSAMDYEETGSGESASSPEQVDLEQAPDEKTPEEPPIPQAQTLEEEVVETPLFEVEAEDPQRPTEAAEMTPSPDHLEALQSETFADSADNIVEDEPSDPSTQSEQQMRMFDRYTEAATASEPDQSPSQVPHLQDEIWMDPTDIFLSEPDDALDDAAEPADDLIAEDEVFGIEEGAEISLETDESPMLDEVLALPFEDEPSFPPEIPHESLQSLNEPEIMEADPIQSPSPVQAEPAVTDTSDEKDPPNVDTYDRDSNAENPDTKDPDIKDPDTEDPDTENSGESHFQKTFDLLNTGELQEESALQETTDVDTLHQDPDANDDLPELDQPLTGQIEISSTEVSAAPEGQPMEVDDTASIPNVSRKDEDWTVGESDHVPLTEESWEMESEIPTSTPVAEADHPEYEKMIPTDSDGPSNTPPAPEEPFPIPPQPEMPAEEIPEPTIAVPVPEEAPAPPKKESVDLRQYLKEADVEDAKDFKSKFRKFFGKRFPS